MTAKPLRILIDARLFGPKHTGIGRYVKNLILQLAQLDTHNHYLLIASGDLPSLPHNFSVQHFPYRHYTLAEQLKLPPLLRRFQPDLIHYPHFNVPLFSPRPFIVTIHDLLWHKKIGFSATTLNPIIYSFKYLAYRLVISHAVKNSAAVITPTRHVAQEVSQTFSLPSDKITTIYESADSIYFSRPQPHHSFLKSLGVKSPFIVYTGSLYPHKNVNTLIESLRFISGISLVIISARSVFAQKTQDFVDRLQLSNRVIFAGFLPDDQVVSLYHQALALVQPSLSEGFGLTGLEAFACSLPVICSRNPVLKEVYQDAALYTDTTSAPKLAQTILSLQKNPSLRQQLIKKSRHVIKQYSWDKLAQQTLKLYQQVTDTQT